MPATPCPSPPHRVPHAHSQHPPVPAISRLVRPLPVASDRVPFARAGDVLQPPPGEVRSRVGLRRCPYPQPSLSAALARALTHAPTPPSLVGATWRGRTQAHRARLFRALLGFVAACWGWQRVWGAVGCQGRQERGRRRRAWRAFYPNTHPFHHHPTAVSTPFCVSLR